MIGSQYAAANSNGDYGHVAMTGATYAVPASDEKQYNPQQTQGMVVQAQPMQYGAPPMQYGAPMRAPAGQQVRGNPERAAVHS